MEGYQSILCATDFSQNSHAAAERAVELTKFYGAQLTLLHVVENFPEDRSNQQITPENIDPKEYRKDRAGTALATLAQQIGIDEAEQTVVFSIHSAKHVIAPFAEENNIDLIVVASHGHHGISSLLGSTANDVINNAACDVLIVRAKM